MPPEYCLALTTVSDLETAQHLATKLVEEGLIACANRIGPLHSTYRWQGRVENEQEFLLLMKTHRSRWEALQNRLVELHPYDTPELIQVPIDAGLPAYLNWVREQTLPSESDSEAR